jgi:putative tryptophan/tyrosine transport system substrate-binding protein
VRRKASGVRKTVFNRKSKTCTEQRRSIRNRKLAGIVAFIVTLALCGVVVEAHQPGKIPRIGFVAGREGPSVRGFQRRLRDLGYIEGKNISVEYRYAESNLDRIPTLINELVQLEVDMLVVTTLVGIRAAKQATKTIPVIMVTTQDPVVTGIIDSLARPGGNITGVTTLTRDLNGKRLELLKEPL